VREKKERLNPEDAPAHSGQPAATGGCPLTALASHSAHGILRGREMGRSQWGGGWGYRCVAENALALPVRKGPTEVADLSACRKGGNYVPAPST
jgi:hypothetical protein